MKMFTMFVVTIAIAGHAAGTTAMESTSQAIKHHAPEGITAAFYACIDKADDGTIASAACLTDEEARQDKRLNVTYKALLGKLKPEEKKELIDAERAWLKFKESNGIFESSIYPNEILYNLEQSQDEIFALCARADALQKYLDVVTER